VAEDLDASLRLFYVAMTRCTQRLHAIYRDALPEGWDHDSGGRAE